VAALAVAAVVWLVWPKAPERTPRALEYQDFDVCLLVDNRGIRAGTAATAWARIRGAVADTKVRLSYLSVSGPQTEEQARLFVPTLVQQGCDVVVAVGANQVRAAQATASTYPDVYFLVVESDADVDEVAARVSSLVPSA
jgi:basic membrane lipoprotein Med (substrate-binding protein (PBP1-ABC) superfamily)